MMHSSFTRHTRQATVELIVIIFNTVDELLDMSIRDE